MKKYEISIIIPIYAVEKYIAESLNSALKQDFDSIEYVLVDDATPDNSMIIAEKILKNSSRKDDVIIVHHEQNRGLSAARNTGIQHSNGRYIFFMDSDDEIMPDCISKHWSAIQTSHADYTVADVYLSGSKSILIKPLTASSSFSPLSQFLTNKYNLGAWNKLYSRKFIEYNQLRFVENLIHEDFLWSYQIAKNAQNIAIVYSKTYVYKIRKESITTSKVHPKKIENLITIIKIYKSDWNNIRESGVSDSFCRYYDALRFYTAISILKMKDLFSLKKNFYLSLQSATLPNGCKNKYTYSLKLPVGGIKLL